MYLPRSNPSALLATDNTDLIDEAKPTVTRLVFDDTSVHYDTSPYPGQYTALSSTVKSLVNDVKASSFNHTLAVITAPTSYRYRLTVNLDLNVDYNIGLELNLNPSFHTQHTILPRLGDRGPDAPNASVGRPPIPATPYPPLAWWSRPGDVQHHPRRLPGDYSGFAPQGVPQAYVLAAVYPVRIPTPAGIVPGITWQPLRYYPGPAYQC
ncbi:hypothetical protein V8D89_003386 [Ganoderma adspersum]